MIFGKQQLVFNSAKNKYDNAEDNNDKNIMNINEDINSYNGSDSGDTGFSTAQISKDSNNSNSVQNYIKTPFSGFLEENKKPDEKKVYKNGDSDDLLTLQIKYALSNISEKYFDIDNNLKLVRTPMCDYYLNGINVNRNIMNNIEKKNKNNRFSNYNYYNKFNVQK